MPATKTASASTPVVKLSAFVKKQQTFLMDLRDELLDAIDGVTNEAIKNTSDGSDTSGSGLHQGDAGSDAYDRDFALSVLANEQDAVYEIQRALERIEQGTYGVCQISGKKIPQARLQAMPHARLTVECQEQWEKENGRGTYRPMDEVNI